MKHLRAPITLLFLLIAIIMVSGIDHAASALTGPDSAITGCCHGDSTDGDAPDKSPCPDPGCPCISCISCDIPGTIQLKELRTELLLSCEAYRTYPPSGYTRTIDYPPERS